MNYGGTMRPIGNQFLSGLTCLAALLTPLSGLPHVVCRCPDGQVKSFCLGITVKNSGGCCCGGACCSRKGGGKCCGGRTRGATSAGHGTRATCCGSQQAPSEQKSFPGAAGVVEAPCCVKTLVGAESLAVAPDKGNLGTDTRHSGHPAEVPAVACASAGVCVFGAPSLAHSPGPPADLVTLFCRLVI
jgi:hypothetical protein